METLKYVYFDVPGDGTEVTIMVERIASVIRRKEVIHILFVEGGKESHTFNKLADAENIYDSLIRQLGIKIVR